MDEVDKKPIAAARKVLCIEDELFIGELYQRALVKAGYDFTVVADGLQGLAEAQTDKYDIILLDLMIPTLSGMEVLQRLRDTNQTPHLHSKIIVATNMEQRDTIREGIERQADGYIIKADITPKQLVDIINNIR